MFDVEDRPQTLTSGAEPVHSLGVETVRYRCAHCGNRTRFDVEETVRRRRFHHYSLGGELEIDDEEILERTVESVTCRWCERSDGIEVGDS